MAASHDRRGRSPDGFRNQIVAGADVLGDLIGLAVRGVFEDHELIDADRFLERCPSRGENAFEIRQAVQGLKTDFGRLKIRSLEVPRVIGVHAALGVLRGNLPGDKNPGSHLNARRIAHARLRKLLREDLFPDFLSASCLWHMPSLQDEGRHFPRPSGSIWRGLPFERTLCRKPMRTPIGLTTEILTDSRTKERPESRVGPGEPRLRLRTGVLRSSYGRSGRREGLSRMRSAVKVFDQMGDRYSKPRVFSLNSLCIFFNSAGLVMRSKAVQAMTLLATFIPLKPIPEPN